jgi:hypothetical protein
VDPQQWFFFRRSYVRFPKEILMKVSVLSSVVDCKLKVLSSEMDPAEIRFDSIGRH